MSQTQTHDMHVQRTALDDGDLERWVARCDCGLVIEDTFRTRGPGHANRIYTFARMLRNHVISAAQPDPNEQYEHPDNCTQDDD